MRDRVASGKVLVKSDIDNAIAERTAIPDKDYQTTALEKMIEVLERVEEFEKHTRGLLESLQPEQYRYRDRGGAEQIRTEVVLYERALERTARVLKDVSKMALEEKVVSLGKSQTELIIRILMGVINDLRLSPGQHQQARSLLLARIQMEGNLQPRAQNQVELQLTSIPGEVVK